jgi:putative ABC transport system ATP-binding protein
MSTAMQTPTAARILEATKVYGSGDTAVVALDEVTLDLPTGRFTAIMGPSGSGKSTLLHCLAGLDSLTEGQVLLGDVELGALSDKELTLLRRARIGFVFQAFNLVPTLTAGENITLPLTLASRRPDPAWLDEVVATVGLGDRLGHRPSELSGGQQQRVATARADQPAGDHLRRRAHRQPRFP